jgi:hypothetical protein
MGLHGLLQGIALPYLNPTDLSFIVISIHNECRRTLLFPAGFNLIEALPDANAHILHSYDPSKRSEFHATSVCYEADFLFCFSFFSSFSSSQTKYPALVDTRA